MYYKISLARGKKRKKVKYSLITASGQLTLIIRVFSSRWALLVEQDVASSRLGLYHIDVSSWNTSRLWIASYNTSLLIVQTAKQNEECNTL